MTETKVMSNSCKCKHKRNDNAKESDDSTFCYLGQEKDTQRHRNTYHLIKTVLCASTGHILCAHRK